MEARRDPIPALDAADLLAHREWLAVFVAHLVRGDADRDDVVQETWVRALPRSRERSPILDARSWLATMARGLAFNRTRGESRRRAREAAVANRESDATADPFALAERAERERHLIRCLLELDEPYRATLLLRFYGGKSNDEIAELRGEPAATVRSHSRRGLERIRERLERESSDIDWRAALLPLASGRTRDAGVVAGATIAGVMWMKWKIITAGVVCASALFVAAPWILDAPSQSESGGNAPIEAPYVEATGGVATGELAADHVERDAVVAPAPAVVVAPPRGALVGRVLRAESLAPVAGMTIRRMTTGVAEEAKEQTVSGLDGRYRIEGLEVGTRLGFVLESPGVLPTIRSVTLPVAGDNENDFYVEETQSFAGSVVDATNREPLAGATVTIYATRIVDHERRVSVVSDLAGRFTVDVPRSLEASLAARARVAGYATTHCAGPLGEAEAIPMLRTTRVVGVVRGVDGKPAAGATVLLQYFEFQRARIPAEIGWPKVCFAEAGEVSTMTDADGRFSVDGAAPWSKFAVIANHGVDARAQIECTSDAPESTLSVDLVLAHQVYEGTAVLEGVLSFNGKPGPLPYRLTVNSVGTGTVRKAGADGKYRHEGLAAGTAGLWTWVPGIGQKDTRFDLHPGTTTRLDVDIKAETSWVGGRLLLPDGGPGAGRSIAIRAAEIDWRVGVATDASGNFRVFTGVGVGQKLIARVTSGAAAFEQEMRGGDENVEIRLPARGQVHLRIQDAATHGPLLELALRLVERNGSRRELNGTLWSRLPGDLVEIELDAGTNQLEVDRSPLFYAPVMALVSVPSDPAAAIPEYLVEVPSKATGFVRIEYSSDPDESGVTEVPGGPQVFWRRVGESGPARVLSPLAFRREGAEATEIELPPGTLELGFAPRLEPQPTFFLPAVTVVAGEAPFVVRVRRAK